jgi:chorismate-pyruvate lyase
MSSISPDPAPNAERPAVAISPFLYPLDDFYAVAHRPLPTIEPVAGGEVPEPYKQLLVHDSDMTSTLAAFHGQPIALDVMSREIRNDAYLREVVLRTRGSRKPVEFGAIRINLHRFESEPRRRILDESAPLGQILADCKVPYQSRPKTFLRITADEFIGGLLGVAVGTVLFARRNTLSDPQQRSLAEIVEILPV